eukprot:30110_1
MATLRRRKVKDNVSITDNVERKQNIINDERKSTSSSISDLEQCNQMFTFALKHKWILLIHLIATMGHICARMLFPIVVGFVVTTITSTTNEIVISDGGIISFLCNNNIILNCSTRINLLNTTALCMLYVNIMQTIFNFIRGYFAKLISKRINCEIRNKLFHCILWNDLSFFECDENGKLG